MMKWTVEVIGMALYLVVPGISAGLQMSFTELFIATAFNFLQQSSPRIVGIYGLATYHWVET